jgi:hypothetical protein
LHIYSYFLPDVPLSVPPTEFTGMLYSCMTTLYELEPEICKLLTVAVNAIDELIRARWNGKGIQYTPPTTFRGWRSLDVCRTAESKHFMPGDPYLLFKDFYFNTFNIVFVSGDNWPDPPAYLLELDAYRRAAETLSQVIATDRKSSAGPKMKRWILDWCVGKDHAKIVLLRIGRDGNDTWKARFIRYAGLGGLVAVEFHKNPKNPFEKGERQRRENRMHQGVFVWYPGETYQRYWQRQMQFDYMERHPTQYIGGVVVTPDMRKTLDQNDAHNPDYLRRRKVV